MEYSFTERADFNLLVIEVKGRFDFEDSLRFLSELERSTFYQQGASILADYTDFDFRSLSSQHVKDISQQVSALSYQNSARRCAIVVNENAHDFGIARMWEIQTQDNIKASLQIFQDQGLALSWLLQGLHQVEGSAQT